MRISVLVLSSVVLAVAVTSSLADGGRSERSIRDWFSGMFKRFQKKENRRQPYYLRPSYPSYQPYYGSSSNYATTFQRPNNHFHSSGLGGGHSIGHSVHGGVHASHGSHGVAHGGITYGSGGGAGHIPHGFGPLKNSDVIDYSGASAGVGGVIQTVKHRGHGDHGGSHLGSGVGGAHALIGGHVGGGSFEASHEDSFIPVAPAAKFTNTITSPNSIHSSGLFGKELDNNIAYVPPANSIGPVLPINPQYIPPSETQLPLESKTGDITVDAPYAAALTSNQVQFTSSSNIQPSTILRPNVYSPQINPIVVDGRHGESVFASTGGPYDPIIEIVFEQGEPLPPPPPPRQLDESLFAPIKDDVHVYFIEYSPEDNLSDLKNLDLTGAQPAVLQSLPNELPFELKNHLLNSGVLENAEIEIIDLDRALTDDSFDFPTRNALRQAYSRTQRQISNDIFVSPQTNNNNQTVDVKVKRLNHDSKSPEGVVEFLSGLKPYRKGTYAGVVEVNDENTNKYLPVKVDGKQFPLPDNLPLENKKVEGVLVLAPETENNKREPKLSTFETSISRGIQTSPINLNIASDPTKQRRALDINWADMDTNGWIPIVNLKT